MDFLNNGNKSELNADSIPLDMSERIISMELDNYLSHSVRSFFAKISLFFSK